MDVHKFIKKRPYLVWHIDDLDKLSESAIVEAVLNNGNWDDVQEIIKILGIKKVSVLFKEKAQAKRSNYRPEIKNYFNLYFDRYA